MTKYYHLFLLLFSFLFLAHSSMYASSGKGNKKLVFIPNVGQVTDQYGSIRQDIEFKCSAGAGLNIFLGKNKMYYQWAQPSTDGIMRKDKNNSFSMYRMDIQLIGGNTNATFTIEQQADFQQRYYVAGLEGKVTNAYRKITYYNVYPNIDWVFYFNQDGKLEHDFVIRPGGKVSDIVIRYLGAKSLFLNADGSLTAKTPLGEITEKAPVTYQQKNKKRIASAYVLEGNLLSFTTAAYSGTLVVDPTIEWSTYFGDIGYDDVRAVVTGKDSCLYAIGSTNSVANMVTTGAHQTTFGGGVDAAGGDVFVTKFTPDGNCSWATYYGGARVDWGLSIACDTAGFIYIAGRTSSDTGIATVGTHQPVKAGTAAGIDAFLAKFDTSGLRLWGTYFGGTGVEGITGVQGISVSCDAFGNVYLAGTTNSTAGIATAGAFQTTKASSSRDGFLAKFRGNGLLHWSTYYGGTGNEDVSAVTIDPYGFVYFGGHTTSSAGVATSGSYQSVYAGGTDCFMAKFDSLGQRSWASYFGGTDAEELAALATDSAGNLYIGGFTQSTTGIATNNSHQQMLGGNSDGFLAKLSAAGQLTWASYLGGSGYDGIAKILVNSSQQLILIGNTTSDTGMITPDALNLTLNGTSDATLSFFSLDGVRQWGTYLGSIGDEEGLSISLAPDNNIYCSGKTSSPSGFATPMAYQTGFGGLDDGFLIKINTCVLPSAADTVTGPIAICEGSTHTYRVVGGMGADTFLWVLPDGWMGTNNADSIVVTSGATAGTLRAVAVNTCGASDTFALAISILPQPAPIIQRNNNVLSVTATFSSYQWNRNGQPIVGATNPILLITDNGSYSLTVTNESGCRGTSTGIDVGDITSRNYVAGHYGIQLYPNPVIDICLINMPFAGSLTVYNSLGQLVEQRDLKEGATKLDCSGYAKGIYGFYFTSKDGLPLGSAKMLIQNN